MKISHGSILAVYFSATGSELAYGADWYNQARKEAQAIANRCRLSLSTVAGVIAALSPSNRWERNLIDATNLCRLFSIGDDCASLKVSSYGPNKRKALAILAGADPLTILGGLKVRAFYGCIVGDESAICIDGHAYSLWLGDRVPTTKTPKISPKLYSLIASDYIKAADQINLITGNDHTAAQIQAITWLAWRRMVKEANK